MGEGWFRGEEKIWTSRFAKSLEEGCLNDFKLTLTSDKPDESWLFLLQDPHLVGGSGGMLSQNILNLRIPEWPFPAT